MLCSYKSVHVVFEQADVSNSGQIGAVEAAAFLKKSGLKEGVLHKVTC